MKRGKKNVLCKLVLVEHMPTKVEMRIYFRSYNVFLFVFLHTMDVFYIPTRPPSSLSLPLARVSTISNSQSHTHTHAHKRARTHTIFLRPKISLSLSLFLLWCILTSKCVLSLHFFISKRRKNKKSVQKGEN